MSREAKHSVKTSKKKSSFIENYKKNWNSYLSKEIAIEYKACLYFYSILVFYCIYLACKGVFQASVLYMCEMIASTYLMGYLQIYCLDNFDEAEQFGGKEFLKTLLCSIIYTEVSYLFGWFDRKLLVTVLFFAFFVFAYWCVYLINKIKRNIDTRNLNDMLEQFKEGEKDYAAN
ncbi:MAG: DUF3021 domain-containing protein [Lachnospiraceae bacterium]